MQARPGFVSCMLQDSGLLARLSGEAFVRHNSFADPFGHPRVREGCIGAAVPARQGVACHHELTQKLIFYCHQGRKERAGRAQEARQVRAARAMDQADQSMGTQSSEGGVIRTQV